MGAWRRPTGFRPHARTHVKEREMEPDETMVAKREKRKDSFGRLSFWFWARAGKPAAAAASFA